MQVSERNVSKPDFGTRYGHYEFLVIPFGLTNPPIIFMDLMNWVCRSFLVRSVIVYIDEILAYSRSVDVTTQNFHSFKP